MDQEINNPERSPRGANQNLGSAGGMLSAVGAALSTVFLLGSAMAASVWAICRLIGLPDNVIAIAALIGMVPVLAAAFWVMGRASHVEKRLAMGLDVDRPVFKLMHYFGRNSAN